jgi:hypothetical protein
LVIGLSDQQNGSAVDQARGGTLILANAAKLVGLGLGVNEAAIRDDARYSVMIFCVCCVLGAQVVENIILGAIERFFGGPGVRS